MSRDVVGWMLLVAAGGCNSCEQSPPAAPPLSCTAKVTEGAGTYQAVKTAPSAAASAEIEPTLRREALAAACAEMCRARQAEAGCAARCQVDAEAGKIGARVRCSGEP